MTLRSLSFNFDNQECNPFQRLLSVYPPPRPLKHTHAVISSDFEEETHKSIVECFNFPWLYSVKHFSEKLSTDIRARCLRIVPPDLSGLSHNTPKNLIHLGSLDISQYKAPDVLWLLDDAGRAVASSKDAAPNNTSLVICVFKPYFLDRGGISAIFSPCSTACVHIQPW